MKFIGMRACKDCLEAESVLKQSNVKFDYVDIAASAENLKFFLDLRENREEFIEKKEEGYLGLPCFLMDDGQILFDENKIIYAEEFAKSEAEVANEISQSA